jgi:hypothetical protein
MRAIAIGMFILITWAPDCWAYGSIARGYAGRSIRFVSVVDLSISEDDHSEAVRACSAQGLASCEFVLSFRDRCVGVAISPTGGYTTVLGETSEKAAANAITTCNAAQRTICTEALTACDETPATEPEPTSDEGGILDHPVISRMLHVGWAATYGGTAIVVALSLWLFATMLSTAESRVLKRSAAIFAWIALPSLPICIGWALIPYHPIPGGALGLALLCWTLVFAALWIGSLAAQSDRGNAPDVLSLPLAALLFSIITVGVSAAFIEHGIVSSPADCTEPMNPFGLCALSRLEGLYFSIAVILVLFFIGLFLREESHLIRLYIGFRHAVSTIKGVPLRAVINGWSTMRSVLLAASYAAAIIGGFVLAVFLDPARLWKENKIGVFEIAAISIVCILAIAISLLLRKVHGLQQLLTALPPAGRIAVDDLNTGTTDRSANDGSQPALAWDPGAIKETFKRKRNEFEV